MAKAYYSEFDPYAAQWLRNLISAGLIAPGDVDERDIRDVKPGDLRGYTQVHLFAGLGGWSAALRLAGWPDDRPVWTGSAPCQPFSAAGLQLGFADERHLWPAFHHLIRECSPPVVFGEQVEKAIGHGWLDLIQADMEGIGYAFGAVCVPAAGVGAPHIRQRLWFFAERLADRNSQQREWRGGTGSGGWSEPADSRSSGWMAHGLGLGRGEERDTDGGNDGHQPHAGGEYTPARMADNHGMRQQQASVPGLCDAEHDPQSPSCIGGVGDSDDSGLEGQSGDVNGARRRADTPGSAAQAGATDSGQPGPTNGFWRAADWLGCRDGRWRPVEPGTFPLVDGSAFRVGSGGPFEGQSRVGMLRSYGNAIVPQVAAEVIKAYMEEHP